MTPRVRHILHWARSLGVYVFALGAGLLAAWAAHQHIQGRVHEIESRAVVATATRLVAAHDLEAGTLLGVEHLALRDIPEPWLSSGGFDSTAIDHIAGTPLAVGLKQGDPLLDAHLVSRGPATPLSEQLAAGRRAITLPIDEIGALSGMLQPDDRIDLYVSFVHQGRPVTAALLLGARVLATGSSGAGTDTAGDSYTTITLDASPQEAARLAAARQSGTLTAMLRHRNDVDATAAAVRGNLATLVGLDAATARRAHSVPVLYGDRLETDPSGLLSGFDADAMSARGQP